MTMMKNEDVDHENKVTWQKLVLHSAIEAAQDDRLVAQGRNSYHVTVAIVLVGFH